MPEVNFGADIAAAEKEFNIGKGSDKFKMKEGENRVRVLSNSIPLQSTFTSADGEVSTNVKFVTWLWDFSENALKLAFLPITIVRSIAALQAKPDYAFTEVPMPYDLLIDAKNAGSKDVKYTVTAARSNSDVPPEALTALAEEKPVEEVVKLIQQKQTPTPSSDSLPV